MENRIRVGMIGAGNIARSRHLPNLSKLPQVDIVAVSNRRIDTAQEVARQWHIPNVVEDWRDIVDDPNIDAVFIATPPHLHAQMATASLNAGKHTFCQARMAMNYEQAVTMAAAAKKAETNGVIAQLCIGPDGLPIDNVMRQMLTEDFFGQLTHGIVVMGTDAYLDPTRALHWRQRNDVSGLNTLSIGIIAEMLHRWIGTFRRVQAFTHTVTRYRPLPIEDDDSTYVSSNDDVLAPVDRPDIVSIMAEHSSGGIINFMFSGVARSYDRYFELHGTKSTVRHTFGQSTVAVQRGHAWEVVGVAPGEQREWTAEADFIESIRTGGPVRYPNPNFHDGLKYMAFTEAVFRSAELGQAIHLPLLDH